MNKTDYQAMFLRLIAAKKQVAQTYSHYHKTERDCAEPIQSEFKRNPLLPTKKSLASEQVSVQAACSPKQPKKKRIK
jgi:hypothetical protein